MTRGRYKFLNILKCNFIISGLSSECEANLYSELYIIPNKDITIIPKVVNITLHQKKPRVYKFFVPENIDHIIITFKIKPCPLCGDIYTSVQENKIPNNEDYLEKVTIKGNSDSIVNLQIWPFENKWHYLSIRYVDMDNTSIVNKTNIAINMTFITSLTLNKKNETDLLYFKTSISKILTTKNKPLTHIVPYKQYEMMRISSAENFIFEYDFAPYANGSSPIVLNVTNKEMSVLKFDIYDVIDIGGTLSLGFAIKPEISPEKVESPNITVVICIRRDVIEVPNYSKECYYNGFQNKAPVVLNNTVGGSLHLIHIPFPDAGTWYITLKAFYDDCLSCKCPDNCQKIFNSFVQDCELSCVNCSCVEKGKSYILDSKDCSMCTCDGGCFRKENEDMKNTSVIFSISSHPCIAGRCGKHGKCNHYIAGGFIYSACECSGGYRG